MSTCRVPTSCLCSCDTSVNRWIPYFFSISFLIAESLTIASVMLMYYDSSTSSSYAAIQPGLLILSYSNLGAIFTSLFSNYNFGIAWYNILFYVINAIFRFWVMAGVIVLTLSGEEINIHIRNTSYLSTAGLAVEFMVLLLWGLTDMGKKIKINILEKNNEIRRQRRDIQDKEIQLTKLRKDLEAKEAEAQRLREEKESEPIASVVMASVVDDPEAGKKEEENP